MNRTFERDISSPQWFAIWTRSRHEKVAASMLDALGVPTFLPLKSEIRQWSDRRRTIMTPLFSGYLFVRIDLAEDDRRLQILKTTGIVGFVGNNAGPVAIPDQQIENIHKVLGCGIEYTVDPPLKQGDRVRVIRGSLSGVEGTLTRTNSETRLILTVELIKRSLSIDVSRNDVELVSEEAA